MCLGMGSHILHTSQTRGRDGGVLDGRMVGAEMAGSDAGGEAVEMEGEDAGDSNKDGWQTKGKGKGKGKAFARTERKRMRRTSQSDDSWDSDVGSVISVAANAAEMLKVKLQFESPGSVNPLKLTKALHDSVGEVNVKPLRDGSLLITCKDLQQRECVTKLTSLGGKKVTCLPWERKRAVQGVITGVPTDMSTDEIMSNVTGANVVKARRLPYTKDGVKRDSLSVLMYFNEHALPYRVKVGYLSYTVRPYIPPPLRCYKCQKFGHVAAVCRGRQRCGKCGGEDHEYGKCSENTKAKCCNCGGEHSAAYKGCEAHKRAAQVQRVRVEEKLTYAEAIKKVKSGQNENIVRQQPMNKEAERTRSRDPRSYPEKRCATDMTMSIDKVKFVAFLAYVINCSAKSESRTERIEIIIRAAEKYLNMGNISLEMIVDVLNNAGIPDTQTPCIGQ